MVRITVISAGPFGSVLCQSTLIKQGASKEPRAGYIQIKLKIVALKFIFDFLRTLNVTK